MSEAMFKPGYEGVRPSSTTTLPERQKLREQRHVLIERLHNAMLTLGALGGTADLGIQLGGTPSHIVEFGDRVGEEALDAVRARFEPTAPQVSDMVAGLDLLQGLTRPYFKVVFLRALNEFARSNGEPGDWPWAKIGGYFGMSSSWAESAYDAAIVQAARRSGLLPMVSMDYAIVVAASWVDKAWLTSIGTAAEPRQAVANLRSKSPVRVEQAFALWTVGPVVAKRIVSEHKTKIRNLWSHGSWYKANPDRVSEGLVTAAQTINAGWMIEDIHTAGPLAA